MALPRTRRRFTRSGALRAAVIAVGALAPLGMTGAAEDQERYAFTGVFRDFRASNAKGGHPDFEAPLTNGRGIYMGIAADTLDSVGDPVMASTGYKVTAPALDSAGHKIIGSKPYLLSVAGDSSQVVSTTPGDAVASRHSFSQWYNETVAAMLSQLVSLTFVKSGGHLMYDGDPRKDFKHIGGSGANKNWGYTFEMEADFVYFAARNDWLQCGADDCLWVYIDGKLVIDLGGSHDFAEQRIDINRITGLEEGRRYKLKLFYAEREKSQSRLKLDTTLSLNGVAAPPVSGKYD